MGFDQQGTVQFSVARGTSGQWHVFEQGFDEPLASFEGRDDAMEYANDLAQQKEGSRVVLADEGDDAGSGAGAGHP
jgi:Uncharacterized protein conserved in bacteria (DUF2188)